MPVLFKKTSANEKYWKPSTGIFLEDGLEMNVTKLFCWFTTKYSRQLRMKGCTQEFLQCWTIFEFRKLRNMVQLFKGINWVVTGNPLSFMKFSLNLLWNLRTRPNILKTQALTFWWVQIAISTGQHMQVFYAL